MLKKIMLLTLAAINIAGLTGCASIVSGTKQEVKVSTGRVNGAKCSLVNNKGSWDVVTPSTVKVNRSYHDLQVKCAKPGYRPSTVQVTSNTRPIAFGNVVFGGVLGAGIDVADGAAFRYPEKIDIPLAQA